MRKLAAYAPALVLVVGCGLIGSATRQRSVPLSAPLKTLLAPIPGYSVTDLTVGDEERRIAGMSDYVSRVYRRDSLLAFTTYVGYYERQAQGRSIHSPKNCLPGAGWEILHGGTATVMAADGPHVVNRYLLKNGAAEAVVYYWYQGRGRVVASEYTVKFNLLKDAALEGHTEEALVRVVVPMTERKNAEAAADRFGMGMASMLMDRVGGILPGHGKSSRSDI
jgi:EpsI family protein